MTAPLVYIAAPLGAPTPTLRRWHRERARLLACLAFAMGSIPVWVHEIAEQALGDDTDPAAREKGMRLALAAVERVYKANGRLWVLLNDNGRLSEGCVSECCSWSRLESGRTDGRKCKTWATRLWSEWRADAVNYVPHLVAEWDRLAERPPECIGSKGCAGEVVYTSPTGTELCQVHLDIAQAESEVTP